jgi:SAM-dependent methyltransferase
MDRAAIYALNRRRWDELVGVHLAPGGYDLAPLRRGEGRLHAIEEAELGEACGALDGRRLIHLQCHFGADTLTLAQRGAEVVGVDFSPEAIRAATALASELGLAGRARFVQCNVYDAPAAVGSPGSFDLAFVTWGAISWLPDIAAWGRVVAHFLRPGGRLYLAEGHPAALVFDDLAAGADGMPGWFAPYFARAPILVEGSGDYANFDAVLENAREVGFLHPLGDIIAALNAAGLSIRFLREHDALPWRMFKCLLRGPDGMWRWPDRPWLPLAFSLMAERPA